MRPGNVHDEFSQYFTNLTLVDTVEKYFNMIQPVLREKIPAAFSNVENFSDLPKYIQVAVLESFLVYRQFCSALHNKTINLDYSQSADYANKVILSLDFDDESNRTLYQNNTDQLKLPFFFRYGYFPGPFQDLSEHEKQWNVKFKSVIIIPNSTLGIEIANSCRDIALRVNAERVDINAYDLHFGTTPLTLAIAKGWCHLDTDSVRNNFNPTKQKDIITALLDSPSIEINRPHLKTGWTPLHIACLRGDDPELIQLLLEKGADPLAKDCEGRTPADLMQLDYKTMQDAISDIAGENHYPFGLKNEDRNYDDQHSEVATVVTEEARKKNIIEARKLLSNAQKVEVTSSASTPSAPFQANMFSFFQQPQQQSKIGLEQSNGHGIGTLELNNLLNKNLVLTDREKEILDNPEIAHLILYKHLSVEQALQLTDIQARVLSVNFIYYCIALDDYRDNNTDLKIDSVLHATEEQLENALRLVAENPVEHTGSEESRELKNNLIKIFLPAPAPGVR